jgi:hypothetical protein
MRYKISCNYISALERKHNKIAHCSKNKLCAKCKASAAAAALAQQIYSTQLAQACAKAR